MRAFTNTARKTPGAVRPAAGGNVVVFGRVTNGQFKQTSAVSQ